MLNFTTHLAGECRVSHADQELIRSPALVRTADAKDMSGIVLNRKWSREVDRRAVQRYGMNSLVLMENAGRGIADKLCDLGIAGPVVITCGKGNNAGDGFVIARHLDLRGFEVRTLLFADPAELRGDAADNFKTLYEARIPLESFSADFDTAKLHKALDGAAWIVDALLGTGAVGEPRPPFDRVIRALNAQPAPILAVDVPSGLDCDTGEGAEATVKAAHTCTFVAQKPGFLVQGADRYTGRVHVLDIGAPRRLIDEIAAEAAVLKAPND